MLCLVSGCRFANTHLTSAHKCGRCGAQGHGIHECGREHRISDLVRRAARSTHHSVTTPCDFPSCPTPWTHERTAHHCACGARLAQCDCPIDLDAGVDTGVDTGIDTNDTMRYANCPVCRSPSLVDLQVQIFTGAECVVCMEQKPMSLFAACSHAVVCADCVRRLS